MKYLVKTRTVEVWEHWYEVEADSGDEANEIITNGSPLGFGNVKDHDERFLYTDEEEVTEVEPFNDEH